MHKGSIYGTAFRGLYMDILDMILIFVLLCASVGVERTRGSLLLVRRLVAAFPPLRPGFEPRSGYVGFVVD
jgi:hypothetical protein